MSGKPPVRNFALVLRYDGTAYHGWQSQKNAMAIQDIVACALSSASGIEIPAGQLHGCGRTDAGVHALSYVASFSAAYPVPPERMPLAINPYLPPDIALLSAHLVQDGFHARFSCTKKEYVYRLYASPVPDPFLRTRAYRIPAMPDVSAMVKAAAFFEGTHDFTAFRNENGKTGNAVRHIHWCRVSQRDNHLEIAVCADGFLYNMVRVIVGSLLYVGQGKLATEDILQLLDSGNRLSAGVTAPPQGLYLHRLWYENGDAGDLPLPVSGEG